VPRITLLLGVLLIVLGAVCYLATDLVSWTALIPAIFGAAFIALGLLGGKDNLRKHAMHAAATLGLVGAIAGLVMVVRGLVNGIPRPVAFWESAALAALCAVFVLLCVKSFIDARRRRSEQAGA
jgi:hypothetical protein